MQEHSVWDETCDYSLGSVQKTVLPDTGRWRMRWVGKL